MAARDWQLFFQVEQQTSREQEGEGKGTGMKDFLTVVCNNLCTGLVQPQQLQPGLKMQR